MEVIPVDFDREVDPCHEQRPLTKWSNAGIVCNNDILGNYVVASRLIMEGELLLEEYPLSVAAYGTSDLLPFCLTCGKDVALSERCSKCKWPICDNNGLCEEDPIHAQGECRIFLAKNVRPRKLTISDYGAIEVIRGLLIRSTDPVKWERILTFESHSTSRQKSPIDVTDTEYIINFVHGRCHLVQFDRETVDKVIGIYSVNTFWALRDIGRSISLLFDQVTLLAHDCLPNTRRDIVEKEVIKAGTIHKTIPQFERRWNEEDWKWSVLDGNDSRGWRKNVRSIYKL